MIEEKSIFKVDHWKKNGSLEFSVNIFCFNLRLFENGSYFIMISSHVTLLRRFVLYSVVSWFTFFFIDHFLSSLPQAFTPVRYLFDQYGHSKYLFRAGKQNHNSLHSVAEICRMFLVVYLVPNLQARWPRWPSFRLVQVSAYIYFVFIAQKNIFIFSCLLKIQRAFGMPSYRL